MPKTRETEATRSVEIVMPREGGPEVLEARQRDLPGLEPGQVMVRVEAAGVSFAEVQMLKGRYFGQPKFPFVPGYDLVGKVEEVGEGVDEELLGRRVSALTETGAWAERVSLDAATLALVPEGRAADGPGIRGSVPGGVALGRARGIDLVVGADTLGPCDQRARGAKPER